MLILNVNYFLVAFLFPFYSFLFIDPIPLFTGMVLILFGKVISGVCKKKRKMEHP